MVEFQFVDEGRLAAAIFSQDEDLVCLLSQKPRGEFCLLAWLQSYPKGALTFHDAGLLRASRFLAHVRLYLTS